MEMHWTWWGRLATLDEIKQHVGPGWSGLLERLVLDLEALGWDGQVAQVKEKFGGLRFYIGPAGDAVHERIRQAEKESYTICEMCGKPGRLRVTTRGWLKTVCEQHEL